ncbi:MAG: aminotransferase class V-fold PLP-dependent enzyme [bacterium]|nr:aminotransferase class V-fold PLP-dependent enzyme [bacterium]
MIYFDNAATSFPKPPFIAADIGEFLSTEAVNPGRSGFDLSLKAGQRIDKLRLRLARFFNHPSHDPDRVIFTPNATSALNIAIQGICEPGDHVVSTVLEHNSVLRPLHELQKFGIDHDLATCDERGFVEVDTIESLLKPNTKLVIVTHASNVLGTVQPVQAIGQLCKARGIHFLLDIAQTAGVVPVDMAAIGADLVAFTGHKGLMGPTGTGGLLVAGDGNLKITQWGGTGVRSAERDHLLEYPYRLEAGTLNTVGLVGLNSGLNWLANNGSAQVETELSTQLLQGLNDLPHTRILGLEKGETSILETHHTAVFSLLVQGFSPEKVGMILDVDWDMAVRTGLQCAPLAHAAMGTSEKGTVRVSLGPFNTPSEIDRLLDALESIK